MSGSYSEGTLQRLKQEKEAAEAQVIELQRTAKAEGVRLEAATVALEREQRTRHRLERSLNELKGHMMYVHDHCGVGYWQRRILAWLEKL